MGPSGNEKGLWVSLGRWKAALAGLRPSIGGTAVVVQIEERYGCTPLPGLGPLGTSPQMELGCPGHSATPQPARQSTQCWVSPVAGLGQKMTAFFWGVSARRLALRHGLGDR
ncbi:unnamed protein product [Clonostachys rhizophaga]|uniref:Uncharacterized protein n=1 Tax=Clonostachys rhizophaga TaxID=160324 RepID=A0A9N9YHE4_9HYPO|nr:unnamed protein product [Clonostachys rhizophaga]